MENVRLKKRLKRKNTKDRKAFYWPRAVSFQKGLEPGTKVFCLEDAIGTTPKLVKVARWEDVEHTRERQSTQYETFIVLLEDLTE